jgi:nucleoside-diphosphate-sugar epimerase
MADEPALEELLSRPTPPVVEAMAALSGDVLVLGAAGKMGPSLCRLAMRAADAAGLRARVTAVARFSDPAIRAALEAEGVHTLSCDLFERSQVQSLPESPNIVYMVGQKFGTTGDESRTWAINAYLPAVVAERFPQSRIVAFSTGNVYPLVPADSTGPTEADAVGPVGEYAQSTLARERVFEFFSRKNGTPVVILRLNYAVEPRYGVLRDVADKVRNRRPVDVTMGWVNLIWQRDANAIALRSFAHAGAPPFVLNVTGTPAISVRWLAEQLGRRFGVAPRFEGTESETALLSDASCAERLFGTPEVGIDEMISRVAEWVEQGGRSLGKPTHFEMREGRF